MAGCLVSAGYARTCETIKKIGGLEGRVWVLNLYDAAGVKLEYTETAENIINAITVQSQELISFTVKLLILKLLLMMRLILLGLMVWLWLINWFLSLKI